MIPAMIFMESDLGLSLTGLALISSSLFVVCLGLFFSKKTRETPLPKPLEELGGALVNKDCLALTIAMTELAQGNLTSRLSIQSEPLEQDRFPEHRQMTGVLNAILSSLQQSAAEFNNLTEVPCYRLCYVGADSFLEGRACGEAMGKALSGHGQVAIMASLAATGPELRRKGFVSLLYERYPGIQVVGFADTCEQPELTYSESTRFLRQYPNLNGIYVTAGATPHDAARAVNDCARTGLVKVIGHDLVDETMRDLMEGRITATLGQDAFAQGYEPVIHIFNHLTAGWQPPAPRLLTHLDLISRENFQHFWSPDKGVIESQAIAQRRSTPIGGPSRRALRIVVLGREDSKFWHAVRDGVFSAAEQLRSHNVHVDWLVPPENINHGSISAAVYGPHIESLVEQKCDGLAVGIFDQELVPFVNRAVEAGIPVITFNSEPTSLRGLVASIASQARRLLTLSQDLASRVESVTTSTGQIGSAMDQIAQGTISQNEQVLKTNEALSSLFHHINQVQSEVEQGAAAVRTAACAAASGAEAVGKTLSSMQSIRESVASTAETVRGLSQQSDRIDLIIKMINSIAVQIRLLGINAAVEAANAGEHGASFLVVAGEIRNLGDRTAQATREITELVNGVQKQISAVRDLMAAGIERTEAGAALAEEAGQALDEIRRSSETNQKILELIVTATTQMQSFSHQVERFMEALSRISEQNASSVEEVSAATREMTSQLEEARKLTLTLSEMSKSEQQLLARFNLNDGR
jgi:methyl-accepting chemotaxis protein